MVNQFPIRRPPRGGLPSGPPNQNVPKGGRTREEHMLRKCLAGLSAVVLTACISAAAQAQDIKLYAFSSGALTLGKGILQNLAPLDPPLQIPVGFYVIQHRSEEHTSELQSLMRISSA